MSTPMSAPIVTVDPGAVPTALAVLAVGIIVILLSALALWQGWLCSERNCDDGLAFGELGLGLAGLMGLSLVITGGVGFASSAAGDMDTFRHASLLSAVEATYGIEDVKYIHADEGFGFGDEGRTPDKDDVCQSVTTESPEYTGVAEGRQISFKVGVEDCRSSVPDVQIIVTATPETRLTPDQLRKQAAAR